MVTHPTLSAGMYSATIPNPLVSHVHARFADGGDGKIFVCVIGRAGRFFIQLVADSPSTSLNPLALD